MVCNSEGSIRTMNSDLSLQTVVSSHRIMKIRTLNDSIQKQTEEQSNVIRIRRKLRLLGLSTEGNVDISDRDKDSLLTVNLTMSKFVNIP